MRARSLSHNSDTWFFFFSFFLPLYPSELPHSPQNLVASLNPAHSHAVVLSWVRPFDGNSPVLYYIVELSENSKSRHDGVAVGDNQISSWLLMSLTFPSGSDPHQPAKRSKCFTEFQMETAAWASGKRKGSVGAEAGSSRRGPGASLGGCRGLCRGPGAMPAGAPHLTEIRTLFPSSLCP